MSHSHKMILASADTGLVAHWQKIFGSRFCGVVPSFDSLVNISRGIAGIVWIDTALPSVPVWPHSDWKPLLQLPKLKFVAASSNPQDNEAISALDAGCAGYCHAFSDPETLLQVRQVVEAGHVWIGAKLMQRLIHSANLFAPRASEVGVNWAADLTVREKEVAILAANGASNQMIALDCKISERTVKAHLSAVFSKLNISDRLQLALRVHGIS